MSDLFDRLKTQSKGLAVRRHVRETIAIVAIFVQALIDPRNNWNFMFGVAIILGNDVIANDLNQICLVGREEADWRDVMHAIQNYFPSFRVPEFLLCERAEISVVAGLRQWDRSAF